MPVERGPLPRPRGLPIDRGGRDRHAAEDLAKAARLELAESALAAPAAEFGGVEFYPDFADKAAVLCRRLIKNHALPDGNKRVGFLCAVEFTERNGYAWVPPPGDQQEGDETVR